MLDGSFRGFGVKAVSAAQAAGGKSQAVGPARSSRHGAGARTSQVRLMLRDAGLRPTRQRVSLAEILFTEDHRHVSAEQLAEEASRANVPVSLATIYNTLHQFTEAGLLREVAIDGTRTYFDTNTGDHHHFFVEGRNEVLDVPSDSVSISGLPQPPEGMEICRVDVVMRIRPKQG